MRNELLAIKPETLLVDLPPVPEWFRRELSQIGQRDGKPMFKLVDGQREMRWRNGKMDVKHLLQHSDVPAYVPVIRQVFRRAIFGTEDYKLYPSWAAAQKDAASNLAEDIEFTNHLSTRAVGRACWIIEVYISPDELGYEEWENARYADLQVKGVFQKVDVLGPFPRDGYYVYAFSVLDEEGKAISPGERTLEECKRRWQMAQKAPAELEEEVRKYEERVALFEKKEIERLADNIYQFHAGTTQGAKFYHKALGHGPSKIKEGTEFYSKRAERRNRHK
jgi:hypothetical protein